MASIASLFVFESQTHECEKSSFLSLPCSTFLWYIASYDFNVIWHVFLKMFFKTGETETCAWNSPGNIKPVTHR